MPFPSVIKKGRQEEIVCHTTNSYGGNMLTVGDAAVSARVERERETFSHLLYASIDVPAGLGPCKLLIKHLGLTG